MEINVETKMTIDTVAHFHENKLKTYPCELYGWWGDETCKEVDFNSEIEKISLPEGEYKIKIIIEKVNTK